MHEGAGALWTERSERATARSWAAVAGIDVEVKKKLGRWKASVDEDYECTTRTQVEQAQRKMAAFVKVNKGRVDPFDEESLLQKIENRMGEEGVDLDRRASILQRLRSFKPHVESGAESSSKRAKLADDMVSVVIDGSDEATSCVDSSGSEKAYPPLGLPEKAEPTDEEEVVELGKKTACYYVSIVGRSKVRTLHRLGKCHRVPGVHYRTLGFASPERVSHNMGSLTVMQL